MSSPPPGAGPVGEEACLEAEQKLVSSLSRVEFFCAVFNVLILSSFSFTTSHTLDLMSPYSQ